MGWTDERRSEIPDLKKKVCEMLAAGLYLSEISANIGVEASTIRRWEKDDADFREDMYEARSAHTDTLEKEATRRARDGVEEVVIHQGKVVMVQDPNNPDEMIPLKRRNYSDTLMMFLLKGQRREIYGDKVETENKHTLDLNGTRERLAAKLAGLANRVADPRADPDS